MTQKELLYLEDAIGHEQNIIKICNVMNQYLEDDKLLEFMKNEEEIHKNTLSKLLDMLEVKSSE